MTVPHLKVNSALDALLDRGAPTIGLCEASRLARDADVFSHGSDLPAKNGRRHFAVHRGGDESVVCVMRRDDGHPHRAIYTWKTYLRRRVTTGVGLVIPTVVRRARPGKCVFRRVCTDAYLDREASHDLSFQVTHTASS